MSVLRRAGLVGPLVLAICAVLVTSPSQAASSGAPRIGAAVSVWRLPIDATFFGVHDDEALRVDPAQWGTGRMHAYWCDVAPQADSDVQAMVEHHLGRAFKVNAKNEVRRLNLTLGHAAPWVFGDDPAARLTKGVPIWYCRGELASTSFPTRASLRAGPIRDAYVAFVRAVLTTARSYVKQDPANLLVLQAWNEPNLGNGGQVKRRIHGAARTWAQAAASLQEQERIIRLVAQELLPGRYEISSPAMYGKKSPLLDAYLTAQAKSRTVDCFSLNFYTLRQKPTTTMASWSTKATRAMKRVRQYRALRNVPVWITETNHNLVNGQPANRANMQALWASARVQEHLIETTIAEAMRLGYAGLEWYQGTVQQVAVNTRAGTVGAAAAEEFLDQTAGRTLRRCTTKNKVVTCVLSGRDTTDPQIRMRWSTKGLAGVEFLHPVPAPTTPVMQQPEASPSPHPSSAG